MPLDGSLRLSFRSDPVMAIGILLLEIDSSSWVQRHRQLVIGLGLRLALRLIAAGGKELPQMLIDGKARLQGVERGVGLDLGGIEEELFAPDQPCLVAEVNTVLKEPTEDRQPQPLSDSGEGGVVGQRLIQAVATVPAMGRVQAGQLDELALGAGTLWVSFHQHHNLEFEEDDRIDAGPAGVGIALFDPVPHKGQIQHLLEAAIEVILGNQCFQGGVNGTIEIAGLRWTEHGGAEPFSR